MAFSVDTFLDRFALPLVLGGAVHIGNPIDHDDLRQLEAWTANAAGSAPLAQACSHRASFFWPEQVSSSLDGDTARLLAGAHNTLFLSHPARPSLFRTGRGTRQVVRFTASCLGVGAPRNDAVAITRHALLGRFPLLERDDVNVRFWAGRREFLGQVPPGSLVAWPGVRRVVQEQRTVRWLDTEMSPEQRALLATLFAASPVTDLLSIDQRGRPQPDFVLLAPILSRPRIARLVCYDYASRGGEHVERALCLGFWRVVAEAFSVAGELAQGARDLPPRRSNDRLRRALRALTGLVQYLVATRALVGDVQIPSREPPRIGFGAVLAAAQQVGLVASGDALGDDEVRGRFNAALGAAREALGSEELAPMVEALRGAMAATNPVQESIAG
ncbi:MAG: hypothetical protein JRH20_10115 [Deltaproteobacteria bacterium]|nr:hypothetical protein [Deltaproteobacteria bacterium]